MNNSLNALKFCSKTRLIYRLHLDCRIFRMSGWNNGAGGQNLDPTFLAQTMINVAQNLISTQQQQAVSMLLLRFCVMWSSFSFRTLAGGRMRRAPGLEVSRPLRASSEQGQGRAEVGAVYWGRDLEVTWGTGARECLINCSNATLRCHLDQMVPGQEEIK